MVLIKVILFLVVKVKEKHTEVIFGHMKKRRVKSSPFHFIIHWHQKVPLLSQDYQSN